MNRPDGRAADQLRPVSIERNAAGQAAGRVLIRAGETIVLCTASISGDVPPWMAGRGKGWVTAEYSMLPGSTSPRKPRDRQKVDGRTTEIQRLIGRCLRAVVDLGTLSERSVTIDCDVLQADGGTRTASITGAYVALVEALKATGLDPGVVLTGSVAAVSVGIVDGEPMLDLCYVEDAAAEVDMNVVATGDGKFVEVQGAGEEATFTRAQLDALLDLGERGVAELAAAQRAALLAARD